MAMQKQNYSINKDKNPFSTLDDDDDASAFMNSSSSYLAADRLPRQEQEAPPKDLERNNILQQIHQVEQRTLDSTKRSIGALIESEQIGVATAEDLSRQREQLKNTEKNLDEINNTLKQSQKNINGIKSVFSSLKQWWKAPKKGAVSEEETSAESKTSHSSSDEVVISPHLAPAVERSQTMVAASKSTHIALKLKGLEDEQEFSPSMNSVKTQSQRVDQQLDDDLAMMSSGLARLKDLASGLGEEIVDQNSMLDRIGTKADRADLNISSQNKQMNRILKK